MPEPYPELESKRRPLAEPLPRPGPGDWLAEHHQPPADGGPWIDFHQFHAVNDKLVRAIERYMDGPGGSPGAGKWDTVMPRRHTGRSG